MSFFQLDDPVLSDIRERLLQVDINSLTPLEALNKLSEIQRLLTTPQYHPLSHALSTADTTLPLSHQRDLYL